MYTKLKDIITGEHHESHHHKTQEELDYEAKTGKSLPSVTEAMPALSKPSTESTTTATITPTPTPTTTTTTTTPTTLPTTAALTGDSVPVFLPPLPEQTLIEERTTVPIIDTAMEQLPTEQHMVSSTVKEVVEPVVIREVQPEVFREVVKTNVEHITQQLEETKIDSANVERVVRPAVFAPTTIVPPTENTVREMEKIVANEVSESMTLPTKEILVEKEPIIHEVIKTKTIQEIQPEIHLHHIKPTVIKETLPIYEKIVETPAVVYVKKDTPLTSEQRR